MRWPRGNADLGPFGAHLVSGECPHLSSSAMVETGRFHCDTVAAPSEGKGRPEAQGAAGPPASEGQGRFHPSSYLVPQLFISAFSEAAGFPLPQ